MITKMSYKYKRTCKSCDKEFTIVWPSVQKKCNKCEKDSGMTIEELNKIWDYVPIEDKLNIKDKVK